MSADHQFPQELIERCSHVAGVSRLQAFRVLRESGHADLVAALKAGIPQLLDLKEFFESRRSSEPYFDRWQEVERILAVSRAALAKAEAQS